MIDAKKFAAAYNAYWQAAAPTCDLFVRRINLDGYDRDFAPLVVPPEPTRRALSAEYAFSAFVLDMEVRARNIDQLPPEEAHTRVWTEATRRLMGYSSQGLDLQTELNDLERNDAQQLRLRLGRFFGNELDQLVTRPKFPGCGYIDLSEGDVILGSTLFEVKAVDRMFRSVDFRQLLTYAALNSASNSFQIDRVGIFNPRRGVSTSLEINTLSNEVSGRTAEGFLSEIVETISSGEISR